MVQQSPSGPVAWTLTSPSSRHFNQSCYVDVPFPCECDQGQRVDSLVSHWSEAVRVPLHGPSAPVTGVHARPGTHDKGTLLMMIVTFIVTL